MSTLLLGRRGQRDPRRCGRSAAADERRRDRRARRARRGRRGPAARPDGRPGRGDVRAPGGVRRGRRPTRARSCSARPPVAERRPGGARSPTCSSRSPCRPTTRGGRSVAATGPRRRARPAGRVVEIGYDAGVRAAATPSAGGQDARSRPRDRRRRPPSPRTIPTTRSSTGRSSGRPWAADRHRLRDRLRELRIAPWADATGEGVALRMAAARAALGPAGRVRRPSRPADRRPTSSWRRVAPGRRCPAPAVALALVDVLRRPGAEPVRARPRPDPGRRSARSPIRASGAAIVADLVDDLLAPLGSVVTPAGHAGRSERRRGGRARRRDHDRARPRARRARARRPAAGRARRSPSSASATPSGSGRAAAISRSTSPAGSAACSWTCATSRSGCPTGPTVAASSSRRGRRRSGRGRSE